MKKKILRLMLMICLIIPAIILSGCGSKPDNKVWHNIGNYEMSFEGVEYTGNSVYVFVEIKNPKNYKTTLKDDAFTLSGTEVLSLAIQNKSGQWVDYSSINFDADASVLVKITFYGIGSNSNATYSLT